MAFWKMDLPLLKKRYHAIFRDMICAFLLQLYAIRARLGSVRNELNRFAVISITLGLPERLLSSTWGKTSASLILSFLLNVIRKREAEQSKANQWQRGILSLRLWPIRSKQSRGLTLRSVLPVDVFAFFFPRSLKSPDSYSHMERWNFKCQR